MRSRLKTPELYPDYEKIAFTRHLRNEAFLCLGPVDFSFECIGSDFGHKLEETNPEFIPITYKITLQYAFLIHLVDDKLKTFFSLDLAHVTSE
jgi:hypothetical protein